ncbi:unnamed protein product, partial [Ectocarpus fasciculatus]
GGRDDASGGRERGQGVAGQPAVGPVGAVPERADDGRLPRVQDLPPTNPGAAARHAGGGRHVGRALRGGLAQGGAVRLQRLPAAASRETTRGHRAPQRGRVRHVLQRDHPVGAQDHDPAGDGCSRESPQRGLIHMCTYTSAYIPVIYLMRSAI